jgi:hypothetical protein
MALAGFEGGQHQLGNLLKGRAIRALHLTLLATFLAAILQGMLTEGEGFAQLRRRLPRLRRADMREAA